MKVGGAFRFVPGGGVTGGEGGDGAFLYQSCWWSDWRK